MQTGDTLNVVSCLGTKVKYRWRGHKLLLSNSVSVCEAVDLEFSTNFSGGPQRAEESSKINGWGLNEHHCCMCFYVFHSWQGAIQECSGGTKGGGMREHPPPVRGSAPPLPPSQKEKMAKISHIQLFFYFCSLRYAFCPLDAPPKNSGAATARMVSRSTGHLHLFNASKKYPILLPGNGGGQMIKMLFGQRLSWVNIWTVLVLAIEHLVIPVWKIGSFWNYIQL